ncbi:18016_t:CDS:2 [Cetraspora pellucida]|uniref:18016_t:CDS:1 n=1 Tax=Cetraspora pellucida TaxID=1433469 RepID=A0ACA9NRV6_9GLOM|nr:18016_t:CDS:2 [Cetraspora pellucida]
MLCYANTVLKDNEIKIVLFIPLEFYKRDSEIQAIFEKDNFYSVDGKIMTVATLTVMSIHNKVVDLNKGLLKISLVRTPQELPCIVGFDENAIVDMLINDYTSQD